MVENNDVLEELIIGSGYTQFQNMYVYIKIYRPRDITHPFLSTSVVGSLLKLTCFYFLYSEIRNNDGLKRVVIMGNIAGLVYVKFVWKVFANYVRLVSQEDLVQ